MKTNLTEREFEQFSAYLDGQLSPSETKRMEELLRVRSEWRLAIEELAATRKLLRSAPRYRAPRNFTLSAETARNLARKPLFPSFPAFRFSAALAALSLLAVAALQVIGLNRPLVAMAPQAAPALEAAPMNKSETATSADSYKSFGAEPTYSFRWSEPLAYGLGGGGGVDGGAMELQPQDSGALKGDYGTDPGGGIVTYGSQAAPEIARGSGGGGEQASQSLVLPPNTVTGETTRDQSAPAEEPAPENSAAARTADNGGGPVLGVPAPGEGGQIIASSGPIDSAVDQAEPIDRGLSSLQIAQIGLGALALLALAAALFFHTRRL